MTGRTFMVACVRFSSLRVSSHMIQLGAVMHAQLAIGHFGSCTKFSPLHLHTCYANRYVNVFLFNKNIWFYDNTLCGAIFYYMFPNIGGLSFIYSRVCLDCRGGCDNYHCGGDILKFSWEDHFQFVMLVLQF